MLLRLLLVTLVAAVAALPQGRGGRGRGPDLTQERAKALQPPQVMQLLRPGLYLVTNRGGNTLFRTTGEGVIVVDTKLAGGGNFERLLQIIRGVSSEPVKYVFNTGAGPGQTGNNAAFAAAGAEIIYSGRSVKVGDVEVRAVPLGPGNTGTGVYFPGDRVIAVGEGALDAVMGLDWDLAVRAEGPPVPREQLTR